ncbi:MAG: hypothetical protein ACYDCK_13535 [Thermoplasmatota archaeon]
MTFVSLRTALFTPSQFLYVGGAILLVVGIVGFFGIIGPTPAQSIFGSTWYFDNPENYAHTVLGIVALAAAFALRGDERGVVGVRRWLVFALGVVGILVGVYSIATPSFLDANLENPADSLLHLAIGGWALAASIPGESAGTMRMKGSPS